MEELSVPPEGTHPLSFATHYSRNFVSQFKICLWKNNAVYWRSPDYNSVRFFFTFFLAILFGAHPRRLPHQGPPLYQLRRLPFRKAWSPISDVTPQPIGQMCSPL